MKEQIKQLTSVNNDIVKYFYSLYDKKVRQKEGLFIIEGEHLIIEASKTNLLKAVLSTNQKKLEQYSNVDKYLINNSILDKLTQTKNPQDIIGIVKVLPYKNKELDNLLKEKEVKLLLLDDINDPGNLGTIIRTTAALGFDAIIMSTNTVDLYNDKVVRSTQGVLFKIPLFKMDLLEVIPYLKRNSIMCFGTSLKKAVSLNQIQRGKRIAVCVGNEARGVSDKVLSLMDQNIKLEMKNDVESLNVSIASSIIMWEFMK